MPKGNRKKYYCEYCGIYLANLGPWGRKTHRRGKKHLLNKSEYYTRIVNNEIENKQRSMKNKMEYGLGGNMFNMINMPGLRNINEVSNVSSNPMQMSLPLNNNSHIPNFGDPNFINFSHSNNMQTMGIPNYGNNPNIHNFQNSLYPFPNMNNNNDNNQNNPHVNHLYFSSNGNNEQYHQYLGNKVESYQDNYFNNVNHVQDNNGYNQYIQKQHQISNYNNHNINMNLGIVDNEKR